MKAKKVIALVLAAILLIGTSIAATVAYFTDTESVHNTFAIGKVGLSLDEADVDEYGVEIADAGRVKENAYKLIPGHTYVKDPTVTVDADSESSYIRMMVEIKDLADVKEAFGVDSTTGAFLPENFVEGWDVNIWPCVNIVETNDTAVYEFRYHTTVNTVDGDALPLAPLFTSFTVPSTVTGAQLLTLDEMEINIVAHAIQADGFADPNAAWAAF